MVLFGRKKKSDDWHIQVDYCVGTLRPSDKLFPYALLKTHTDHYIKKKGKSCQQDTDIRLRLLIENHEARDVAIGSCAHAMAPAAVQAVLNAELNVAPTTFYGLETYLQSLIAANFCSPKSITDLEAHCAQALLPYAMHGHRASGRYLEGICAILMNGRVSNMNVLPNFAVLTQRALNDFASQIEGLRLRCIWTTAYTYVTWLHGIMERSPPVASSGSLLPEHFLDSQLPAWRIWANWRPDLDHLRFLESIDGSRRSVLPDLLALEGPDFISGKHKTLRDGMIEQYGGEKSLVRFRSLIIEVKTRSKDELKDMLRRVAHTMADVCRNHNKNSLKLFVQLCIARPITEEALKVLEGVAKVPSKPGQSLHNSVLEIYTSLSDIGGKQLNALCELLPVLDDQHSEHLRNVLVHADFVKGVERCITECQSAVRMHIETKLAWTRLLLKLHEFLSIVKTSESCLSLLDASVRCQLDVLPTRDVVLQLIDVYNATRQEELLDCLSSVTNNSLKDVITAYCINGLMQRGTIGRHSLQLVRAVLGAWKKAAGRSEQRSMIIVAANIAGADVDTRCHQLLHISSLPHDWFVKLSAIFQGYKTAPDTSVFRLTKLLTSVELSGGADCWKAILHQMIEQRTDTLMEHSLNSSRAAEWISFMLDLHSLFRDVIATSSIFSPPILRSSLHLWVQQVSGYTSTLTRLERFILSSRSPVLSPSTAANVVADAQSSEGLSGGAQKVEDGVSRCSSSKTASLFRIRSEKYSRLEFTDAYKGKGKAALRDTPYETKSASTRSSQETITPNVINEPNAIKCILKGGEGLWVSRLLEIVAVLHTVENWPIETMVQTLVCRLSPHGRNTSAIFDAIHLLTFVTPEGSQLCQRLLDSLEDHTIPIAVIEVLLASWLQAGDGIITDEDRSAIRAVASLLDLDVHTDPVPDSKLVAAANYFNDREAEVLEEAARLHQYQKALKAKDPAGTSALLRSLGIKATNALDEELESLPSGIFDAIEKRGSNDFEMSFPLTSLSELHCRALGIHSAGTLLVRLTKDCEYGMPPAFCVHADGDLSQDEEEHYPWLCFAGSEPPYKRYCQGKSSILTWQLSRLLHRHILSLDFEKLTLLSVFEFIKSRLQDLAHWCVVCGITHNARQTHLRRPMPCTGLACVTLWNNLPLKIRIPEIWTDRMAVDLLLTGVHAAAMSGRTDLLPGCPITNTQIVIEILNSIPSLVNLQAARVPETVLEQAHKSAGVLLTWACTYYRGYIVSAAGMMKIPGLPQGTHQFILAQASPLLEAGFANKLPNRNADTRVLFHGTSLDRLPSILAQGLAIKSGTSFQRTGAAHGRGIYLADEPATSFTYAPAAVSWRGSALNNMKLMFGCEVVGQGNRVTKGIHVIKDERSVMVRYVFLFAAGATVPIANHVVTPMASAMSALRNGAA